MQCHEPKNRYHDKIKYILPFSANKKRVTILFFFPMTGIVLKTKRCQTRCPTKYSIVAYTQLLTQRTYTTFKSVLRQVSDFCFQQVRVSLHLMFHYRWFSYSQLQPTSFYNSGTRKR